MKKLLVFPLLFVHGFLYADAEPRYTEYIEFTRLNWGYQYEWIIFENPNLIHYTLIQNNNGHNRLRIATFDRSFNSTTVERSGFQIEEIIRFRGNVVSLTFDRRTYRLPERLFPATTLNGFFDFEWGTNKDIIIEKLKEQGLEIIHNEQSANQFSIISEYAGMTGEITFIFYENDFISGTVRYPNITDNSYQLLLNHFIRLYGRPVYGDTDGTFFVWLFDNINSISVLRISTNIVHITFNERSRN